MIPCRILRQFCPTYLDVTKSQSSGAEGYIFASPIKTDPGLSHSMLTYGLHTALARSQFTFTPLLHFIFPVHLKCGSRSSIGVEALQPHSKCTVKVITISLSFQNSKMNANIFRFCSRAYMSEIAS